MYRYRENILPDHILNDLREKYCNMHNHDDEHWFLRERYKSAVDDNTKYQIVDHLISNVDSPFYKDRRLLNHNMMHINKLGTGGALPPHTDTVAGSLTVFLNTDWCEQDGGLFLWTDSDNVQHTVVPKYNCGVWDHWPIPTTGSLHEVTVCNRPRYSLQLFYGIGNNRVNIGVTPDSVDLSLYSKQHT